MKQHNHHTPFRASPRLRAKVYLGWGALWVERAIVAFWPVLAVLAFVLGLARFDHVFHIPYFVEFSGLSLLILSVWGVWRFRVPRWNDVINRLDMAQHNRAVSAVFDSYSGPQDAIWGLHQDRMLRLAEQTPALRPSPQIAHLDRFGIFPIGLWVLALGVVFGTSNSILPTRTAPAQIDDLGFGPPWEGWVLPPEYTRLPSLYLLDLTDQSEIEIFVGSDFEIRSYQDTPLSVRQSLDTDPLPAGEPTTKNITFSAQQQGEVQIEDRIWQVSLLRDQAPFVEALEGFQTEFFGKTELQFEASDDFGIVQGEILFEIDFDQLDRRFGLMYDHDGDLPFSDGLPLPLRGNKVDFVQTYTADFSKHKFAHLPMKITLRVEDAVGQIGTSTELYAPLPARRFFDPIARVFLEHRRDLLWSVENRVRVARMLRAIRYEPDAVFDFPETEAAVSDIITKLEDGPLSEESRQEVAELLWSIALTLEEVDPQDALERMRQAQERLEEAMRNGASDEEIAELMQELRRANEDYMRQLQQEAERDRQNMSPQDRDLDNQRESLELSQDTIQEMMDKIEELMREGRMAEAQQALQELQQLMENLQAGEPGEGQGGQPNEQALNGLGETLQDQQDLSDQSFGELQRQTNPNAPSLNGPIDPEALAEEQRQLRERLSDQMENLPNADGELGEQGRRALEEALDQMEQAEEALRDNDLSGAIDNQAGAMDALRQGIGALDQALEQQQAEGQDQSARRGGGERRDPLGRAMGQGGQNGASDTDVGTPRANERAQELRDEIENRLSEQERAEQERDYLRRLLDRF